MFSLLRYQFSVRYIAVFLLILVIFEGTNILSRFIPAWILTFKDLSGSAQLLYWGLILLFYLIQIFLDVLIDSWIVFKNMLKPWRNTNKAIFPHLMGLDIAWHNARGSGATASKIPKGISRMVDLMTTICWEFAPSLLQFLLSILTLAIYSPKTVIPIILSTAFYIWVTIWSSEYTKKWRKESNELEEKASSWMVQMIRGLPDILFSGNSEYFVVMYQSLIDKIDKLEIKASRINLFVAGVARLLIARLVEIFLMYLLFKQYEAGDISALVSIGNATVVLTLFKSLHRTARIMDQADRVSSSVISTNDLFKAEKTILGGEINYVPQGNINFRNLNFSYPGSTSTVLNSLSLEIKQGQLVAFVGPSGAGKSTIIAMLTRLYDPNTGSISIGKQTISSFKLQRLYELYTCVPQKSNMFHWSVRDNVLMGTTFSETQIPSIINILGLKNPEGFDSDGLVWLALNKVGLKELFTNLDQLIGENGVNLSGGQSQRLSMARALIKSWYLLSQDLFPVIILDEPTSALDAESESIVMYGVNELHELGCTVIIIAHRLSTISNADVIFVMKEGYLTESGNHAELMDAKGLYFNMVNALNISVEA